jgi:peptidoglycan hydrolase-like protein with peptidoglycan-binding domain
MAVFTSVLFTKTDPTTKKKLENCLNGVPNQQTSHFSTTENSSGAHITIVQIALQKVIDRKTDTPPIPAFNDAGKYGSQFAESIKVFKRNRGLKNYAGVIDGIVGMGTIKALDQEAALATPPAPTPTPTPVPVPLPIISPFEKNLSDAIDLAIKKADSAQKVLYWATCSLAAPGVSAFNDKALKLVDRCFKINEHSFDFLKLNDIAQVKRVFTAVANFLPEMDHGKKWTTISPVHPTDTSVGADAWLNGRSLNVKTGITYYLNNAAAMSIDDLAELTVHESVHFAGGIDHWYDDPKNRKGAAYLGKALLLKNSQALQNASSYAYLSYFSYMPSSKWDAPVDSKGNVI